jgi:hypothetical protein
MMPPPAAGGGMDYDYPAPRTAQPPVRGQYGRMMPQSPDFNYSGPARQSGWSSGPGYMDMPTYGYDRAPVYRPEDEVPPPSTYPERPPYGGGGTYPRP